MPNVDNLNIAISATAQKASSALDSVIGRLDRLSGTITKINTTNLNSMANGFERIGRAMNSFSGNSIKVPEFNKLATGIGKLTALSPAQISNTANALNRLTTSIKTISGANVGPGITQIADLAKGIAQLGYKSSTQAVANIPKLAVAMRNLISTLASAPRVSQNVINLTNALARLARTGASSGRAAAALSQSLNIFSNSASKAKKSGLSLASAIGKMYATYWLLFRIFGKIKQAMDLSSALTEVQNVVDVTFGNAVGVIEKFAETAISKFGISELAAKKTASTYQAMGTAMGFTKKKMADMSVELTALSADMASFYNVSQADVAEDLQAVFTGMTRPLRQYGLDLTEATLKEWALKNGMNGNIKAMSQAQKTMLRYQYVLANTGAAQGDFQRTQMTWANQTRILIENFKALGTVIGGMFTNAFKPLVVAINSVMGKLIEFAETVSNSLGKIFGWTYQKGGGGMTSDFEDSAGYSDDIANSTGKAAKNVDKMKKGLRAFDELKTIDLGKNDGGGSGSGGGSGAGAGSDDGTGGQWVQTESIFEKYESSLNSLYKLGAHIGNVLTRTLDNIDWDKVYYGAINFGKGLASFLNGLISPELFGSLGRTIAKSLNSALRAVNAYAAEFDWSDFGNSLASGINNFFLNFDFNRLGRAINIWVDGFIEFIVTGLKNIRFIDILKRAWGGLAELDLSSVLVIGALVAPGILSGFVNLIKLITGLKTGFSLLVSGFGKVVAGFNKVWNIITVLAKSISPLKLAFGGLVAGLVIFLATNDDVQASLKKLWKESILPLVDVLGKTLKPVIDLVGTAFSGLWNNVVTPLANFLKTTLHTAFSGIADIVSRVVIPIIGLWIDKFKALLSALPPIVDFVSSVFKPIVETAFKYVGSQVNNLTNIFKGLLQFVTGVFSGKWASAWSGAKTAFSGFVNSLKTLVKSPVNSVMAMFEGLANGFIRAWNNVKKAINSFSFTVPSLVPGIGGKKIGGFNLKMTSTISLPRFASGGFPEDGTFRASHGEIMGRFDNGKSVVANNRQITDGISAAVYQGNKENNALLREQIRQLERQNELLNAILEKEGITKDALFRSVKDSAKEYRRMTGSPAFI